MLAPIQNDFYANMAEAVLRSVPAPESTVDPHLKAVSQAGGAYPFTVEPRILIVLVVRIKHFLHQTRPPFTKTLAGSTAHRTREHGQNALAMSPVID